MKKMLAMALYLMTALVLSACGQKPEYQDSTITEADAFPNVSMVLFNEEIDLNLMTLEVVNNNDFGIESGGEFWVEEYRDGKWQAIVVGEKDFTGGTATYYGRQLLQVDVSSVYGELPEGHYRILKCFRTKNQDPIQTFYLSAEFDLS